MSDSYSLLFKLYINLNRKRSNDVNLDCKQTVCNDQRILSYYLPLLLSIFYDDFWSHIV